MAGPYEMGSVGPSPALAPVLGKAYSRCDSSFFGVNFSCQQGDTRCGPKCLQAGVMETHLTSVNTARALGHYHWRPETATGHAVEENPQGYHLRSVLYLPGTS